MNIDIKEIMQEVGNLHLQVVTLQAENLKLINELKLAKEPKDVPVALPKMEPL